MTAEVIDYVNFLVEKGNYEIENATVLVNKLKDKIDEIMVDDSPEARNQILNLKIRDLVMASNVEKYDAIIVAMDAKKDANSYQRYLGVQAFKENPARAVAAGIVIKYDDYIKQLIDAGKTAAEADKIAEPLKSEGNIIVLDSKKFFDDAQTKRNNNFGKPLPIREQRELQAIIDGKLVRVFADGDIDVKCGYEYTFFGSLSKNGNLSLAKTPMPKMIGAVDDNKLWEAMYNAALDSDKLAELCNLQAVKKNHIAIVKGYILNATKTSKGSNMLFIGDEAFDQGVACFSCCPEIESDLESFGKGSEVIAIAKVNRNVGDDGQERHALFIMGIVASPISAKLMDISNQLDEILID